MQTTHLNHFKIKMNSSTSYRTWIGFNDNSEGGITVYSVACYLSQGLQVDVFAFEHDAYLYLVDQAERPASSLTGLARASLANLRRFLPQTKALRLVAAPRLGTLACKRSAAKKGIFCFETTPKVLDRYNISIIVEIWRQDHELPLHKKQNLEQVTRYADMLSAMGTEPRLRIMQLLLSAHPDGLIVGEIGEELEIPSSTLSHHLEKLKNEDLVKVRREGTFLWYSANTEALQDLLGFLYAECCTRNKAIEPRKIFSVCK
jgi:ArsR family transcriptional regulator